MSMEQVTRLRLSSEELSAIDAAMDASAFKNRSTWMRHHLRLAAELPSSERETRQAMLKLADQFASIGRNINQAVKAMNKAQLTGGLTGNEIKAKDLATTATLLRQAWKLYGDYAKRQIERR